MKKNISINLQGLIFHIEEDGYDVLSRYLAEVKAHFSSYRGHQEIVADIEGRIAELFAARLSGIKQVVTLDDVTAMTAKMGRVSDFQSADEAEEDDELLADAVASGTATGTYAAPRTSATDADTAAAEGPRRLYRDMTNRKIAGVAAGIARYFAVNPLWIRLGLLGLCLLVPIQLDNTFGWLDDLGRKICATSLISYIVLWIVLPKRYDTPPEQDDHSYKKLYRDTDNGKVGGVSAGLAAYLNTDVTLIRVLFIVGLFVGGISFILYPLLWILLPEAKTVSEKMRMRGDAVTLSGIDSSVRNNAYGPDTPGNNRPVGTFLEDVAGALNPLLGFVGSAIRIFAGLLLIVTGFSLLLGFAILLGVGLGLIPESDNIVTGAMPAYVFLNGISPWAVGAFFLTTAIPALALLLAGLGLLLRRTILHRSVALSLLGLWLLGIVGSSVAGTRLARDFQQEGEITQTTSFTNLKKPRLVLERRQQNNGNWLDLDLIAVDSGQTPRLERVTSAKGPSEEVARRTAATSILHSLRTPNDSTLSIDDHFTFQPGAQFRNQEVRLRLLIPRDRTFRMSEEFADWLNDEDYVGGRTPLRAGQHVFRFAGSRIECADCKPEDLRENDNSEDYIDGASDNNDDSDDDSSITLDYGKIPSFNTNEDYYGPERQRFDETDFDHVSIVGGYRVLVRQGSSYSVKAAGGGRALRDIKIEREGNELIIRPRNRDLFDSRRSGADKVLITIETPELNNLELVGGTRAEVRGFNSGNLRVEQAGGSQLRLDGNLQELRLELAGGCRTALQGSADKLSVDGAGACEVAAAQFTARQADIDVVGGSKVRVRVTEDLKADAVGASVVEYSGNPGTVRRDATGASSVRAVD